ncbi:MAG: calcium/sodium antiporter [Saprospiraceae bacterium]|nr:calcium/sodium antiporter [Saprospiraceae bacterium]
MITYLLFIVGIIFLLKGGDMLVDGSSSIAKNKNISPIVIGLTIVAFGTSAPELVVNLIAASGGNTEIAIGNVLGSNIANILLILGIAASIYPISAKKNTVLKEIPFSLLAAVLVAVTANDIWIDGQSDSAISRIDGIVYLLFFTIFLYYIFGITESEKDILETETPGFSNYRSIVYVVLGIAGMFFGGKWVVDGAVKMAEAFQVSQSLIGLTVVAISTSLPELATSTIAAYKRQTDIAIGNVVGSNIFNVFWILGLSSLFKPLPFKATDNPDILVTIFSSLLLLWFMFTGKKHTLERWQGYMLVLLYVAYLIFTIATKSS